MANLQQVKQAVARFVANGVKEGSIYDLTEVDYDKLLEAINDENARGSAFSALLDFNDTVGLDMFGIKYVDSETEL